jgi:competence protein ComGF
MTKITQVDQVREFQVGFSKIQLEMATVQEDIRTNQEELLKKQEDHLRKIQAMLTADNENKAIQTRIKDHLC